MRCEQTPAGAASRGAVPAHTHLVFTRHGGVSHWNECLAMRGRPEKQCLDEFGRFLLRLRQRPSEKGQHWMCTKPLAFLSHHRTGILQHLPGQNVPFWSPRCCSQCVLFSAASQTLRGRGEVSEDTWVMGGSRRSRPWEPLPSERG